MENVVNALDELISYIIHTKEYEKCISLKKKMKSNEEIMSLIQQLKNTQKKYVQSNYDSSVKEELDLLNNQLMSIPIYHMYNESLEQVNEMISYVKDSLNDYFDCLLNEKN